MPARTGEPASGEEEPPENIHWKEGGHEAATRLYNRDTCQVARELLGKYLVRVQDGLPLVVRINETEAYIGRVDKACHAYNYRRTARTETSSPAGHGLYLPHLWYVSLPEFRDGTGK